LRWKNGAPLDYWGALFVVSDGADVVRTLDLCLDPIARVLLRETVVLGRSGQASAGIRECWAHTG